LIVGITGATGTIFGARLLQALQTTEIESHLVVSKWAARTLLHETPYTLEQARQMATHNYPPGRSGGGAFQWLFRDTRNSHRAVRRN